MAGLENFKGKKAAKGKFPAKKKAAPTERAVRPAAGKLAAGLAAQAPPMPAGPAGPPPGAGALPMPGKLL